MFTKRVASATSGHGSWILCPRRVHRPCVDTENPETCQVPHESPGTGAVNGVLEDLDTCGLDEVLLKRDVGSVIRILVNPVWVGRGEKTMAEKCSKHLHQSNSMSENAAKRIETPVTTSDWVLPEWSGCKVDNAVVDCRMRGACAQPVREAWR